MAFGKSAFLAGLVFVPLIAAGGDDRVGLGRRLFEENWLRPPADDSPLAVARGGDGLGPLFNGASCAECHHLGGSGGAGPNEHNVEVVSAIVPFNADEKTQKQVQRRASAFHPAFLHKTHVVLHRFGIDPTAEAASGAYEAFREDILSHFPATTGPASESEITTSNGVRFQIAHRNTPAVFGAGVIDRVSPGTLQELAARQRETFPRQAGRPAMGGSGRFGWRGQVTSLESFVRTACAEECGLRVGTGGRGIVDQPAWPLRPSGGRRTKAPVDLTEEQVEALLAFSAALPAPQPVPPEDLTAASEVHDGQRLFSEVGCAACHVEHVGPATHIYSDLLLHDMGLVLADRVKAPPADIDVNTFSASVQVATGSYYSEIRSLARTRTFVDPPSLNEIEMTAREWKTPPLWGVADSAPYLHDGRAETLDEAIRLHGGQGEESTSRYAALPERDRSRVLAFLGTLKAPAVE